MAGDRVTWTQPICTSCWVAEEGERTPGRIKGDTTQICCACGRLTDSGIYVRRNPMGVKYPRVRD